jgi:hypothetical protein
MALTDLLGFKRSQKEPEITPSQADKILAQYGIRTNRLKLYLGKIPLKTEISKYLNTSSYTCSFPSLEVSPLSNNSDISEEDLVNQVLVKGTFAVRYRRLKRVEPLSYRLKHPWRFLGIGRPSTYAEIMLDEPAVYSIRQLFESKTNHRKSR